MASSAFPRGVGTIGSVLQRYIWLATVFVAVGLACGASARAEPVTVAIEDKDYAPYYVWVDGEPTGPCVEITRGTFEQMGMEVEFVRSPWSRVLRSVEEQKVDAGLCGTRTDEREAYSHYPDEPLLLYDATLFARADAPFESSDAAQLAGRSFGMVRGYTYAGVDAALEEAGMVRVEAATRESLWKLLQIGRIDTALDSILPMIADTRRMGIAEEIRILQPSLAETPGYLFFSKKPGNDTLAQEFSDALRAYKESAAYEAIMEDFGF